MENRMRSLHMQITMFILVDIYEDILEYYVQVRIFIYQTKDTNCPGVKRTI